MPEDRMTETEIALRLAMQTVSALADVIKVLSATTVVNSVSETQVGSAEEFTQAQFVGFPIDYFPLTLCCPYCDSYVKVELDKGQPNLYLQNSNANPSGD